MANIFLCTSIPAIQYGIGLSWGSGERASSHQSGSQAIVGSLEATTPNYSFNHARSGSNSCSASTAPLAQFDLAAPAASYSDLPLIFISFRGPEAHP
jgi:hypothetical protein